VIVRVKSRDAPPQLLRLDDGIALEWPTGYRELVPVGQLSALWLEPHPRNPTLTAHLRGGQAIPYALDPESRIVIDGTSLLVSELTRMTIAHSVAA
jgi:hypothetical protein